MGLLRSCLPFDAERRIPLSTGMGTGVLLSGEGIRSALHPIRLLTSGKPVQNDGSSVVGSLIYPCPAVLVGSSTEFRVTAFYPRFTPAVANHPHGGYAFTSALEEWELHPHGSQVIQ